MYALSPSVNRLPITDYFADIGNVSMDALAGVTPRLPTTDHRLLPAKEKQLPLTELLFSLTIPPLSSKP